MVSQVVCVVCSISPEPHTTEITFHKFPSAIEAPNVFNEWKKALASVISVESSELVLKDTYICSRHFTAIDFTFVDGKLILLKAAVPTRIIEEHYSSSKKTKSSKEYEPSQHANNFASTLTKDFMTTSRSNLMVRSAMVSTETSRILTPTTAEFFTTMRNENLEKNDLNVKKTEESKIPDAIEAKVTDAEIKIVDDVLPDPKKRNIDLEHKIQDFHKIFKRLRRDNLLTESYLDQLKVNDFNSNSCHFQIKS